MEAYIPQADGRKKAITEFFANSGQEFLPNLELLIDAKEQLHDFTHAVGAAAIEGLLELSSTQLAGPPHPDKAAPTRAHGPGAIRRHGHLPVNQRQYIAKAATSSGPWRDRHVDRLEIGHVPIRTAP